MTMRQGMSPVEYRRALGRETGEIPPPRGSRRVALIYPNTYKVAMSSLGYQAALYLMRREGLAAERFFALEPPFSAETESPPRRFDVLAFSISFEMDWLHTLEFLRDAGIPLKAEEREQRHPLILVGGVCVSVNRAPIWPFADVIAHGEAEILIPAISRALRDPKLDRRETLKALAAIPGIEITHGCARAYGLDEWAGVAGDPPPTPPAGVVLDELDKEPCVTRIFSPDAEFASMGLIDLARGCPHHCTFCWIGHNAPPYRRRSPASVAGMASFAMRFTDRIGLVSSAVGAHAEIDDICRDLISRGARISYSSLRVEEVTSVMLEALAASGQHSITIAPEAGSERVRKLLGKRLPDTRIFEVVEWALAQGMRSIKMYFMTGIPSETEDEADEIVRFTEKVRAIMVGAARKSGVMGSLGINLGLFVPKPDLPLLRVRDEVDFGKVSARLKRIVRGLNRIPNTRVMASSPELNGAQGILSVGGLEAADFLLAVLESGGDWRRSFREFRRHAPPLAIAG